VKVKSTGQYSIASSYFTTNNGTIFNLAPLRSVSLSLSGCHFISNIATPNALIHAEGEASITTMSSFFRENIGLGMGTVFFAGYGSSISSTMGTFI